MNSRPSDIDEALRRFGLQSFRPGQREVIESIVAGQDCLCVMPTGGGKSLCYQLPSVFRPGLTIVVSPLIALMKDQVDRLGQLGIPAALINSTQSMAEQQQRLQDAAAGKFQLVYVAPERLRNARFLEAIRATPIQLLAIDEAHCISQWGHDFRPDYTRIGQFRQWLGGVQTVALTATATPRVRDDIVQVLQLERPQHFMSGFARPNLHFGVVQRQSERDKDEELERFLRNVQGSGIIYSATRKRCDELVEWISKKLKISVGAYHAGLLLDQRRAIQDRFMRDELRVIVATNAFGMGIDKPDLRFVIHYNMPGSLEAYYQEAGRAGRDGKRSQCVMLYSFQDRYIQEFFIDNNYPARDVIESTYDFLAAREEDPIEMTLEEIRDALGLSVSPEAIGSSLQIISRTRVLERLETGGGLAMIRIDSELPTLVDMLPREAKIRRSVLRLLERAVGDRRGEHVLVHPRWLLQESGLQRETLNRALRELIKLEPVDYVPPFRGRAIHFVKRGVPFNELGIDFESLAKRKDAEYDRLNQVVHYAQSPLCRQTTILNYFGDTQAKNCQRCDRCARSPGWPKMEVDGASSSEQSVAPGSSEQLPKAALGLFAPIVGLLSEVLAAIERVHGRLGKHLISQFLSGSQNAKVTKLNLHRMGGFGLLKDLRQADVVELLDGMLAAGILQQSEVSRNRPTISLASQMVDLNNRRELLASLNLSPKLIAQLSSHAPQGSATTAVALPSTPPERQATDGLEMQPAHAEPTLAGEAAATVSSAAEFNSRSPHAEDDGTTLPSTTEARQRVDSVSPKPRAEQDRDWQWTLKLFAAGFDWAEVQAMRRMVDGELALSLCEALKAGAQVSRSWLAVPADAVRSAGQQRVLREMQRRAAAGIR